MCNAMKQHNEKVRQHGDRAYRRGHVLYLPAANGGVDAAARNCDTSKLSMTCPLVWFACNDFVMRVSRSLQALLPQAEH
jgi:hypothetical protein